MNKKLLLYQMDTYLMKSTLIFAGVLALIDQIWVQGAKAMHIETVESVQKSSMIVDKKAAVAFYLIAGLAYTLLVTRLAGNDLKEAAKYGAILGAAMYFTFDLTNKAIFKDYTWEYAIKDGIWGVAVVSLAAVITTKLLNKL